MLCAGRGGRDQPACGRRAVSSLLAIGFVAVVSIDVPGAVLSRPGSGLAGPLRPWPGWPSGFLHWRSLPSAGPARGPTQDPPASLAVAMWRWRRWPPCAGVAWHGGTARPCHDGFAAAASPRVLDRGPGSATHAPGSCWPRRSAGRRRRPLRGPASLRRGGADVIDVLLPFYGDPELLLRSPSAASSTRTTPDLRLVVVDDCYPTPTSQRLVRVARGPAGQYHRNATNLGVNEQLHAASLSLGDCRARRVHGLRRPARARRTSPPSRPPCASTRTQRRVPGRPGHRRRPATPSSRWSTASSGSCARSADGDHHPVRRGRARLPAAGQLDLLPQPLLAT